EAMSSGAFDGDPAPCYAYATTVDSRGAKLHAASTCDCDRSSCACRRTWRRARCSFRTAAASARPCSGRQTHSVVGDEHGLLERVESDAVEPWVLRTKGGGLRDCPARRSGGGVCGGGRKQCATHRGCRDREACECGDIAARGGDACGANQSDGARD